MEQALFRSECPLCARERRRVFYNFLGSFLERLSMNDAFIISCDVKCRILRALETLDPSEISQLIRKEAFSYSELKALTVKIKDLGDFRRVVLVLKHHIEMHENMLIHPSRFIDDIMAMKSSGYRESLAEMLFSESFLANTPACKILQLLELILQTSRWSRITKIRVVERIVASLNQRRDFFLRAEDAVGILTALIENRQFFLTKYLPLLHSQKLEISRYTAFDIALIYSQADEVEEASFMDIFNFLDRNALLSDDEIKELLRMFAPEEKHGKQSDGHHEDHSGTHEAKKENSGTEHLKAGASTTATDGEHTHDRADCPVLISRAIKFIEMAPDEKYDILRAHISDPVAHPRTGLIHLHRLLLSMPEAKFRRLFRLYISNWKPNSPLLPYWAFPEERLSSEDDLEFLRALVSHRDTSSVYSALRLISRRPYYSHVVFLQIYNLLIESGTADYACLLFSSTQNEILEDLLCADSASELIERMNNLGQYWGAVVLEDRAVGTRCIINIDGGSYSRLISLFYGASRKTGIHSLCAYSNDFITAPYLERLKFNTNLMSHYTNIAAYFSCLIGTGVPVYRLTHILREMFSNKQLLQKIKYKEALALFDILRRERDCLRFIRIIIDMVVEPAVEVMFKFVLLCFIYKEAAASERQRDGGGSPQEGEFLRRIEQLTDFTEGDVSEMLSVLEASDLETFSYRAIGWSYYRKLDNIKGARLVTLLRACLSRKMR